MVDLNKVMEEERQRLTAKLEDIAQRRVLLDQEEQSVNIELSALAAYFDTKLGTVMKRAAKTVKARAPRKTGIKQQVLETIQANPGITRADLMKKLGAEDKAAQGSVSNMLQLLKNDGKVESPERGTYKATVEKPVDTTPKRVPKETTQA